MARRVEKGDLDIAIRFGGGVHSRASEDEIDDRECSDGENFDLDPQNRTLRNRKPFDKIGTVANAGEIRGFISLVKTDGSAQMAVQAEDKVYEWDGASTFTEIATVAAGAKLRGRIEHNWQLDDKVIITDLALADVVMDWDGSTFQDITFNPGESPYGSFKAKYCIVSNERAWFANLIDETPTTLPHMIVGTQRGDHTVISVSDRPSSSLNEQDPFFLLQPDFHAVNGLVESFGKVVTSSRKGSLFYLTGDSAKDFAFDELYPRSGADGDEAVAYIGNDIIYGRVGVIESLSGTDRFGDSESDDYSLVIGDKVRTLKNWTIAYNSRLQRVYCFAASDSRSFVLHKSLVGSPVSPWSIWKTNHPSAFQPTAIMNCLDPADGLEYVFFGDSSGNVYRMEGSGSAGDGGEASIRTQFLSKMFKLDIAQMYRTEGWITFRKGNAQTVQLGIEYAGENITDEQITLNLTATSGGSYFGDASYFGGEFYFGVPFAGRLVRQKFDVAGQSTEAQVRITIESTGDFEVSEIGLRFQAVS